MASQLPDNRSQALYLKSETNNSIVWYGYKTGYLAQNLSEMEEQFLVCKKCHGIMKEPSLCNGEISCLVCSRTPHMLNTVNEVQSSISRLQIKCPLLRDCEWKGKLSEAEGHLGNCLHFLIRCDECKQVFPRGVRGEHVTALCPMRVVECQYCHKRERMKDIKRHLKMCPEYSISCVNNCGARFPRSQLPQHRSECELEEITCPYKEYGCDAKSMLRRDLLAHKRENIVEHTDLSLVQIRQQETELIQQRTNICNQENELRQQITQIAELKQMIQHQDLQMKGLERRGRTIRQLVGVEWVISRYYETYTRIDGPIFNVNCYALGLCCIFRSNLQECPARRLQISFFIKRVDQGFDSIVGTAVTQYRMAIVNQKDSTKPVREEGKMDYKPKIGSESQSIVCYLSWDTYLSCLTLTRTRSMTVRFYFQIDTV